MTVDKILIDRSVLEQALEALERNTIRMPVHLDYHFEAIKALRAALEQPSDARDAARWRFLVDNSFDKSGVTQFHVWEHSWEPHSKTGEPTEWKARVRGPALDYILDRAIERAHEIGEQE